MVTNSAGSCFNSIKVRLKAYIQIENVEEFMSVSIP